MPPQAETYDQDPPEPITLPQVQVSTAAQPDILPMSARYIPRSCMYLRWNDSESCQRQLGQLASLLDTWSPGFWGAPATDILAQELARLGIDDATWQAWQAAGVDDLALASWDAAFASGTNLLVYVHATRPLADVDAPHSQRLDAQSLLLATDAGLLKRGLSAKEREKALAQDPHLSHAWEHLPLGDGEQEQLFVFLSDYWFTNLLSPRWQILGRRRSHIDARIRLVELLREMQAREQGSDALPDLATLESEAPLSEADKAWIFAGLQERDDGIVHALLGGIGTHPPIDQLSFDTVSTKEWAFYEAFSPISRQSEYRQLQFFVLPQKVTHRIADLPSAAAGLSLMLRTEMASGMLGQQLPLTVNLQAQSFDTAPRSLRPDTWLEQPLSEDQISWYRTPAVLIAPRLLFDLIRSVAVSGIGRMPSIGSWQTKQKGARQASAFLRQSC
jgi:hypothetical protein